MKLTLLKDWGKSKAGEEVEVKDNAVIKKGLSAGLFADGDAPEEKKQDSKTSKKVKKNEKDN